MCYVVVSAYGGEVELHLDRTSRDRQVRLRRFSPRSAAVHGPASLHGGWRALGGLDSDSGQRGEGRGGARACAFLLVLVLVHMHMHRHMHCWSNGSSSRTTLGESLGYR